jgi:hypothetical protein
MSELICLVADKNMEAVMQGLFPWRSADPSVTIPWIAIILADLGNCLHLNSPTAPRPPEADQDT